MTHRLGTRVWATGIAVLAAASACGGTAAGPGPGPSTTASTSPASSTPSSPSSLAAENATTLLRTYFATLDAVRSTASEAIGRLSSVTTSIELSAEQHLIQEQRARGLHQTGTTRIDKLQVESVNLGNSDPSAGKAPTVSIAVCWDVTNADLVDKGGHSVVSSARPKRGWTLYTVANYQWSANPAGGWRVADSQDLKRTPCSAP